MEVFDYKDDIIEKLIKINEEQIQVNVKFAEVTEKNNKENQKTFKLLIITTITAIVIVCVTAMCLIHTSNENVSNVNKNINSNVKE